MDLQPRQNRSQKLLRSGRVRIRPPGTRRCAGRVHSAVHYRLRAIGRLNFGNAQREASRMCIQRIEGSMNHRSTTLAAGSLLAALLTAGASVVRGQAPGPMAPPASKAPAPPPAVRKPEAPPIPPDEMISRFAQKEDAMVRAMAGLSFQQSIRLE